MSETFQQPKAGRFGTDLPDAGDASIGQLMSEITADLSTLVRQEVELAVVPGKRFLAYRSRTRAADDGRPLHAEDGFLRSVAPGEVELVVAQGSGIVEAAGGAVDGGELLLASTTVAGTPTAKDVQRTERTWRASGDELEVELSMAAVGEPMTAHLRATLRRR